MFGISDVQCWPLAFGLWCSWSLLLTSREGESFGLPRHIQWSLYLSLCTPQGNNVCCLVLTNWNERSDDAQLQKPFRNCFRSIESKRLMVFTMLLLKTAFSTSF